MQHKITTMGLNNKKWIIYLSNGLIFFILFMIFGIFIIINNNSQAYELDTAIKHISIDLNRSFIKGGIILSVGLFLIIITKLLKRNLITIVLSLLTIILYYLKVSWIGI
jgi:hypothetical protein